MTNGHIAYMDGARPIYCRSYRYSSMVLCDECTTIMVERHPQGWSYYPGDTCMHGVLVGGVGVDLMCHRCEMGYTKWVDDPTYQLMAQMCGGAPSDVPAVNRWMNESMNYAWDEELPKFFNQPWWTDERARELGIEWYALKVSSGYWSAP